MAMGLSISLTSSSWLDISANSAELLAAPSVFALRNSGLDTATIETWIAQARLENDGSLTFQQGIANLQRLLAVLIPEKTALLANYPNPFNPETWIPYQLAQVSLVQIRIWTVSGTLVRTLDLGYQSAGVYQQRSRAAYWDGRNQLGELVASGVCISIRLQQVILLPRAKC